MKKTIKTQTMKNRFAVKIKKESLGISLCFTNNRGNQWTEIIIPNPQKNIPLIIEALLRHLPVEQAVEADSDKCPQCVTGKFRTLYVCNKCGYEQPPLI